MNPTAGVLFAGIGAACLGLERAGFEIVYQCEIDPFCRSVLDVRFPHSKKYEDIKNVRYPETTDIIFGSPPCQPYSQAGQQRGHNDDRALWPEMRRIIAAARPTWVVLENVAGMVGMVQPCEIVGVEAERNCPPTDGETAIYRGYGILAGILEDFEKIGYDVTPFVIPACAVDAPHRRDRLWIVAHSRHRSGWQIQNDIGRENYQEIRASDTNQTARPGHQSEIVAHASSRHERQGVPGQAERSESESRNGSRTEPVSNTDCQGFQKRESIEKNNRAKQRQFWPSESGLDRVDDGPPPGVDRSQYTKLRNQRTRAIGNAVVPQIVETLGRTIIAIDTGH